VHYWAYLQSVQRFRCYDNSAESEMPASACTRSMPGLGLLLGVIFVCFMPILISSFVVCFYCVRFSFS